MDNLFTDLQAKKEKVSVIGLGYVGLPVAIEFAKKYDVIGYDINEEKVNIYRSGVDVTNEVGDKELQKSTITLSTEETDLQKCKFHVIAVPTPINMDKTPNLAPIISASRTVGRNLVKGSIIVFESTVYPGTTEEICVPVIEEESGLKYGVDFKVGYSPERINPGDKVNTLTKITKVVSGSDEQSLRVISDMYASIIEAGVFEAESIRVAEAAKVIENSQRDINIAFMNELAMVFNKMGIDTAAVLEAARTKWNFLPFTPGLVGGHCIGVDPYYFTYKAEQLGYHSQIILAGRKINEGMGKFVADSIVKTMINAKLQVHDARVGILGLTFKENVGDVRNTKVIDIVRELEEFGVELLVHDPEADPKEVKEEYHLRLVKEEDFKNLDVIVYAVPHEVYLEKLSLERISDMYRGDQKVLIDIKSVFKRKECEENGFIYWSL